MKKLIILQCLSLLFTASLFSQKADLTTIPHSENQWTGTDEQKIWGLMQVWSEAKSNFPYFDHVPDLDWDQKVIEYLPRVIKAGSIAEYYDVLMEFAALLHDGHTAVVPPWNFMTPGYDHPPVELKVVGNKFIVAKVGDTDEMKSENIYPGLEILETGDKTPMPELLKNNVLRYYSFGTVQADESIGLIRIFSGQQNSKVVLKVKDMDGAVRDVTITRNSTEKNGSSFQWQFVKWFMLDPVIISKMIQHDIWYVRISNFGTQNTVDEFHKVFDTLDLSAIKGIIIDIRYNSGGNSAYAYDIISSLTDKPLEASKWKSLSYVPAYRSWGKPTGWLETDPEVIEPGNGKKYTGPLVVLTGPATFSAAEDFLVPLKYSKRALLVGEKTAGSTGNPVTVTLPGNGLFRVVSKRDMFPDGTEFVGIGIIPDVEVRATQEDIFLNNDPVLKKGAEVILNWDKENKH